MIEKFICPRCGKSDVIDEIKVPQENTMLTLCDECRTELHGSDEFFNFDSPMVKGESEYED